VDGLKKSGVIDKGMIPKADSAVAAIKSGVEKSFVCGRPRAARRPAGNFHRRRRGDRDRALKKSEAVNRAL